MSALPAVTPTEMARVDALMANRFGVDTLQLMELAGRAVALAARTLLPGGDPRGRSVLVLAGRGGNGGDGLVAARFLHAWGARVAVRLSHPPDRLSPVAARQLVAVRALDLPIAPPAAPDRAAPAAHDRRSPADLVIDALLGFGLAGPPTGPSSELVRLANAAGAAAIPVLAVDVPSGLDAAAGTPFNPCVRAAATLTLGLPKTGLLAPAARPFVGRLTVADIGIPPAAYAALGRDVGPVFAREETIRLW